MDGYSEWAGRSGNTIEFEVYNLANLYYGQPARPPHEIPIAPGIYIFSFYRDRRYVPIYIGQSDDLYERLVRDYADHHKRDCIEKNQATEVHIYRPVNQEATRLEMERDFIKRYVPPCND